MFVSETHLPMVLSPQSYYADEYYQREMSTIFEPAWHFVCALSDLPADNSYLTTELMGRPLIVWRTEHGVQAFLNVCAHRHAKLKAEACGTATRLKCSYHGWEYDGRGASCHIPDAQSFRPLGNTVTSLTKFPTETCGNLVFVRLTAAGPSLAEHLGNGFERLDELFTGDFRKCLTIDRDFDVNWKFIVENSVESYHVDSVHAGTFGHTPDAKYCHHQLEDRWSSFEIVTPQSPKKQNRYHPLEGLANRILGYNFNRGYCHTMFYPNVLVAAEKMFRALMVVTPRSATRVRFNYQLFALRGARDNIAARVAFRQVCHHGAAFTRRVLDEDMAIWPGLQQAISSPQLPSRGLISVREERVFHFQQFIARMTGESANQPVSPPTANARGSAA